MTFLILVLGAMIALTYAALLLRTSLLGVILVLVLFLAEATLIGLPGIDFIVTLYPQDMVFSILFVAAVVRFLRTRPSRPQLLLILLLCLWVAAVIFGVQTYGWEKAGNEARSHFYFLAGAAYFGSFTYTTQSQKRLLTCMLVAAGFLMSLAAFRWTATAMGLGLESQWSHFTQQIALRVLPANEALFLSQLFLVLLIRHLDSSHNYGLHWLLYVLGFFVLVLQHRTVWVATAVGAVTCILPGRQRLSRGWGHLLTGAAISAAFLAIVLGITLNEVYASLVMAATEPFAESSTWKWRVDGWRYLLSPQNTTSAMQYLTGKSFGAGFNRYIGSVPIDVSPHNFYIQTYLQMGGAGIVALVGLYYVLWRSTTRKFATNQDEQWLGGHVSKVFIVSQLVYFIAYHPSFEQGLLLGLCLSMASTPPLRTSATHQCPKTKVAYAKRSLTGLDIEPSLGSTSHTSHSRLFGVS